MTQIEEMELLDKCALAALPAIISLNRMADVDTTPYKDYLPGVAEAAYDIALAMLVIRKQAVAKLSGARSE